MLHGLDKYLLFQLIRYAIDEGELKAFKIDAKEDFDLTDEQIEAWLKRGTLIEVQEEV